MGAKTCPDGLTARQRSEKRFQVKRISGAQALGQEPARGLGKSNKASATVKERGEAKKKMRPEKEAGATFHQALQALVQWLRLWN